MVKHYLSKSKLLSFLQCPRRLYLEVTQRDRAIVSASAKAMMETGHVVGAIARSLHADGILIESQGNLSEAIRQTAQHLAAKQRKPLFEATFQHDGALVRTDLLLPTKKAWHLVEVKSSTSVKEYHLSDAAIQRYVLEKAGVAVDSVSIQVIDNTFVYAGKGCYQEVKRNGKVNSLFAQTDVSADIAPLVKKEVSGWIKAARKTLDGKLPAMTDRCNKPYPCPFIAHCHADGPEYPVDCLPNIRTKAAAGLRAQGYDDIRDIPVGVLTNKQQERVRKLTASGKPELLPEAATKLSALGWPRYYLDFETMTFAVPIWKATHPFQHVPFQWSCHIERKDGSMVHREFLDLSGDDPSRAFAQALLAAVGKRGPILVYNIGFEGRIVKELALRYKDLANLLASVAERFVDLLPITRENYYHPAMKGSWSLKDVLPTIAAELDYAGLEEVQDGGGAQRAFGEAITPDTTAARKKELERVLLAYCKRDTEAMVTLTKFLLGGKTKRLPKNTQAARPAAH
jgi:CRISPR/Cas system-associated exonuclease Cas4 (RecB family)